MRLVRYRSVAVGGAAALRVRSDRLVELFCILSLMHARLVTHKQVLGVCGVGPKSYREHASRAVQRPAHVRQCTGAPHCEWKLVFKVTTIFPALSEEQQGVIELRNVDIWQSLNALNSH